MFSNLITVTEKIESKFIKPIRFKLLNTVGNEVIEEKYKVLKHNIFWVKHMTCFKIKIKREVCFLYLVLLFNEI